MNINILNTKDHITSFYSYIENRAAHFKKAAAKKVHAWVGFEATKDTPSKIIPNFC